MKLTSLQSFMNAVAQSHSWSGFQTVLIENTSFIAHLFRSNNGLDPVTYLEKSSSRKKLSGSKRVAEFLDALEAHIAETFSAASKDPGLTNPDHWMERYVAMFLRREYHRVMHLEETRKYQVALEILLDPGVGFALVDMDQQVNFCNSVMETDFGVRQGGPLPEALSRLAKKKPGTGSPHYATDEVSKITTDYNFFNWNNKNFRVTVRLLDRHGPSNNQPFWAITIQPAVDAFSRTNRLAQRVGLSWREVEICSLLHDGLDPNEVSNRLFISKHTVKTYLKRIYRKCGVHSRAQLIALLNQYSGSKYVV